jgi:hypothetical protein
MKNITWRSLFGGSWFEGVEQKLELLEGDDIEEGHKNLGILNCDGVRLSLEDNVFFRKHAAHSALGALHNIDIISDFEVSLGVHHEYVVLGGYLIFVKEDLNGLGAALVVTAEEGLEVRPGRRIRVVSKVNISIEGIGLI